MITSTYSITLPETINLALVNSAVHYCHPTQQVRVTSIAVALNGTTINSAGNVVVTLAIVGGAALGTVNLANGTTAGQSAIAPVASVAVPVGSVISATVTTAATVAAGTGSVSLGLSIG